MEPTDTTSEREWDESITRRALDELYANARRFSSLEDYKNLLNFVKRFRTYSPYNAMLVQLQMPGACYVAPAYRWMEDYKRLVKPGERPLVILRTMGPVMFVFDVSQTEPGPNAEDLPDEVLNPFRVTSGTADRQYERTTMNAQRDGILVADEDAGSLQAGCIRVAAPGRTLVWQIRSQPKPEWKQIPVRYEICLNKSHDVATKYSSLVHELAHLYCGHLGTPNTTWWPDRRHLTTPIEELEAESVSYLVCERLGLRSPAAQYLSGYLPSGDAINRVSVESVMRVAGLIEQMGARKLALRSDKP